MVSKLLGERPWRTVELPADVYETPTMLSTAELQLLYTMARDYCSGAGRIVDAGCFLGGSTRALLAGLRDRADDVSGERIVSYDRFEVEEYFFEKFGDLLKGLAVGDSFRPLFDSHLAGFEDQLAVRAGDLVRHGWQAEPIELLFLDVLKTWEMNDLVLREFFGHLIPERSIVIQQDYGWGALPWIHITMELLADCFRRVDDVADSRVFLLDSPIPAELLNMSVRDDLSRNEQRRLMDRAVDRAAGDLRGMLELARAWLLLEHGRGGEAAAAVVRVRDEYATSERVQQCVAVVSPWFDVAPAAR